jgi:hypothetical protein
MKEDNKVEEERGTRGALQIGEKVDVGIWCWKGTLGHGYPRAIMAIPYSGLFIAAICNSRSIHGQYTRSSTEQLQYGAVTNARLLGRNYRNRNQKYGP